MKPVTTAAGGKGPLTIAARGKGPLNLVRRAEVIGARYGVGPQRMDRRLAAVHELLERYGCGATLPVTAAAVERNPRVIARYAALGIEFAVHGYYHVDHTALSESDLLEQLGRARRLLEAKGVPVVGFRAPYLRWNEATIDAVRASGFLYDSSQAIDWPVQPELETAAYRRALAFYGAVPAGERPVLPRSEDGIVRIPYCLPDDEAVLDRLRMTSPEAIGELWLGILHATHRRGELFTLAVHPERIGPCAAAIGAVLQAARAARPKVWIARIQDIAQWWRARAASTAAVTVRGPHRFHLSIHGPKGLTVLARDVEPPAAEPWADRCFRVHATEFEIRAERRPFIGVHPNSPDSLSTFLRDQGYIVEVAESRDTHAYFLRRKQFSAADERPLLDELEAGVFPVVRLGRWPDGAQSALSVTGDVDALTIWDYAFRFLGR